MNGDSLQMTSAVENSILFLVLLVRFASAIPSVTLRRIPSFSYPSSEFFVPVFCPSHDFFATVFYSSSDSRSPASDSVLPVPAAIASHTMCHGPFMQHGNNMSAEILQQSNDLTFESAHKPKPSPW
jgi:hypothetical protein